jgi:polyhydroxyalkanoate synthesis regulator phasin
MLEIVQKVVFTGLSFMSFSLDKVKEIFEQLVQDEKISPEEGEKIVREIMRDVSNIKEEVEFQLKDSLNKILTQVSSSTTSSSSKEERVADLMARLEALEEKEK